jgi:glycosyltransferase involved in cell wall biosynthesis
MRLLYVHESFGHLAGAEASVFITASELKKRGQVVGLASRRRTGKGKTEWSKVFGDDIFSPVSLEDWRDILQKFKPDAIYMHKWEDLESIEFLLGTDLPLVRMVHDHDIYCLRSYKYNPFTRRICTRPAGAYCIFPCLAPIKRDRSGGFPLRWVSYFAKIREIALNRRFDRHLVVTEYMRNELLINGFENEQIETFAPVPRPVEPLRSNFGPRNLLIYAGQITRGKGVDVMLRALKLVCEPFEAIILGDGHYKLRCEKLCKELGLEDRVKFHGFVPQAELRQFYQDASAVMISSVWPEPIATIGLEVMRYALPVVAFDAGGIGDWLKDGDNGFLVRWMDLAAYADRIDRLLRDKELARRMGEKGLERVSRDYDFDQYIARLEGLFLRVAREPRRRKANPASKS